MKQDISAAQNKGVSSDTLGKVGSRVEKAGSSIKLQGLVVECDARGSKVTEGGWMRNKNTMSVERFAG